MRKCEEDWIDRNITHGADDDALSQFQEQRLLPGIPQEATYAESRRARDYTSAVSAGG